MESLGEVEKPKEGKKQLSNENRLRKKKTDYWLKGGKCIIYTGSFPIDANCFKSQRNNRQTELALGGKTFLVIKLGKCLFFFKC